MNNDYPKVEISKFEWDAKQRILSIRRAAISEGFINGALTVLGKDKNINFYYDQKREGDGVNYYINEEETDVVVRVIYDWAQR